MDAAGYEPLALLKSPRRGWNVWPDLDGQGRSKAVRWRDAAGGIEASTDGDPNDRVARRLGAIGRPCAVPAFGRQQLRDTGGNDSVIERQFEGQRGHAVVQPGQMPGQFYRHATSGSHRLEDAVSELEAAVVHGNVGCVRRDQPAVKPDVR